MIKYSSNGLYNTRLGVIEICQSGDSIVQVKFLQGEIKSKSNPSELTDTAYSQILEYLDGHRKEFDFPYKLNGTDFQLRVWRSLLKIPYGETRSYKDIANMVGSPNSSRAVGSANNRNPMSIIIPCHRVIGSDGSLVGYAAGLRLKKALLRLEKP